MKRVFCYILLGVLTAVIAFSASATALAEETDGVIITSRAAYLIDSATGKVMFRKNADERYPVASIVKVMTALLTMEEIENGNLKIDEKINISQNASGMGGSQMFLDTGLDYPVGDLIKGVIVVSANDCCVALAERIAGSEEGFVDMMNKKAAALNMNNTNFVNCTGLPAAGGYSSAKDVSIMFNKLIKYDLYHEYSKIWLEDYVHPDGRTTTLTNTNKLIRFYQGCNGGKTGFTNEAKFCLAVSAERNGLNVISVLIGGNDSKTRFDESRKLLDYGFANYRIEVLAKCGIVLGNANVSGGKERCVGYAPKTDLALLLSRSEKVKMSTVTELCDIIAPVNEGDTIGKIYGVSEDGTILCESDLVAVNSVEKAGYGDSVRNILSNWGVG